MNMKRNKKTILVADTHATSRKLLAVRLQSLEYETTEAGNTTEAEEYLASQNFDLVISDAEMFRDEMGKIKEKLQDKETPVFLLTDDPGAGRSGLSGGELVKEVFHRSQKSELLLKAGELLGEVRAEEKEETATARQMLLIEDSPTIRGFLRRILVRNFPGWVIREAEEGRQAMAEMSNKKVDFIITDLQMPGMDGQAFLKILHRNPVLKNKPVLVLSSSITQALRDELADSHSVRLLAKPSSEEEITATIRELMENAGTCGRTGPSKKEGE